VLDLLLVNALCVMPDEVIRADVGIKNEKIAGIYFPGTSPQSIETIDCEGGILLPGVIDTHAHVTFCEDYLNGTRSAVQGGVTTIVEMPQSGHWPNLLNEEVLDDRKGVLEKDGAYADVALWSGIDHHNLEQDIESLFRGGCVGFKIFTCEIAEGYPCFCHEDDLYRLFCAAAKHNALVTVHAQSNRLLSSCTKECSSKGGAELFSSSQPVLSELTDVNRVCLLSQQTGCKVHICHISSPEILELITSWRQRGADVTAETCPHYLSLTEDDVVRCGAYAKVGPPIRNREAREGLWEALKKGFVDSIGTDHAAYSEQQKNVQFWEAPGGFPSLDLVLPILVDEGVLKRNVSWTQLAHVCSTNIASRLGLSEKKGSIKVGLDADLVLIDINKPWVFHSRDAEYLEKSTNYPYEGRLFNTSVRLTLVRGHIVCRDREIVGEAIGRFTPHNF